MKKMGQARYETISEYMVWAKTCSHAKYNLATSGVVAYSLRKLRVNLDDIELSGPSGYGYEPLQQALAAKCGVSTDCVVSTVGTSLANHLAMAAVIESGDEVLVESPVYEPILALARYLGADIKLFQRRFENKFLIDPDEVERHVTPRTRLIVITNLHNPTSALVDEPTLQQIGEIARRAGARVLVDEVYLEVVLVQAPPASLSPTPVATLPARSAFHLGSEFIVTSSLTKAYGLSGIRCGWILAEPKLARRMWRLTDIFHNIPAHAAERLSVLALKRIESISERARLLLERNHSLLNRFLDSRDDLETVRPGFGTVVFPRLKHGSVDSLCALLREKYETSVVPGSFFSLPNHFRVGIGGEAEMVAAGLDRLSAALDELG